MVEHLDNALLEPLDFDCPLVVVRTDEGYDPLLEEVVSTIDTLYSRPHVHDLDKKAQPANGE